MIKEEVQLFVITLKTHTLTNQEDELTKEIVGAAIFEEVERFNTWFDNRFKRLRDSTDTLVSMMLKAGLTYTQIQNLTRVGPNRIAAISKADKIAYRPMEDFEPLANKVTLAHDRLIRAGFKNGMEG